MGYEQGVALIAANDTNTTAANIVQQTAYMLAFQSVTVPQFGRGMYDDTDLAAVVPFDLGHLPNAYSWSAPTKSVAVAKAKALGYHMIQGRLTDSQTDPSYVTVDGIAVDLNHCIRDCYGWGKPISKPPTKDDEMAPAVIHNTEPRAFPFPGGPVYQPGVVKYLLMEDGRPRRATGPELTARGLPTGPDAGTGWSNQDFIDAGGEWTEPTSGGPVPPAQPFPTGFTGVFQ
jgi:hypothetical protein